VGERTHSATEVTLQAMRMKEATRKTRKKVRILARVAKAVAMTTKTHAMVQKQLARQRGDPLKHLHEDDLKLLQQEAHHLKCM